MPVSPDDRMRPAMDVLLNKRRKDGTRPVQAKYPGQVHFDMEKAGGPSQWERCEPAGDGDTNRDLADRYPLSGPCPVNPLSCRPHARIIDC